MKIFLSLLICVISINVQSQNFGGGIIAGVSTSQVSGDRLGGFNKAGLLIGGFVNRNISSLMSLQMEMTYIQKGSNNPKINENLISDISLAYVEVPVLLKYQQSETVHIEFGIETAFLISAYDNDLYGKIESSRSNPFNKTDVGALLGIDYKISTSLVLNTRISNSILPIRPHASGATFKLNKGQYNSVLSFALHYTI